MVSDSSSGSALAEAEGFVLPVPAAGFVAVVVAGVVACVAGGVVALVVGVVGAGVVDVTGAVAAGGCVWPVEGFCLLSSA